MLTSFLPDHLCTDTRIRGGSILYCSYIYSAFPHDNAIDKPYMQHEELLRTDIRDGQDGLSLLLDIGVMDVTTCTPIENALVDICELFEY